MAFQRDIPQSFAGALQAARQILSANLDLVIQNLVDTEAEQLVLASYRAATGRLLTRVELFTRVSDRFPEEAGMRLLVLAGSRAEGKPLQYLTGVQVFLNHEYEVGPEVLIPRPETEVLVESAISILNSKRIVPELGLEIGIGSGILSIELLSQFPTLQMIASELSQSALEKAKKNASSILGTDVFEKNRLRIIQSSDALDVWGPFRELASSIKSDFIISNPPYLISSDEVQAQVLAYEPHQALFAPAQDALYFYRMIAEQAQLYLKPQGFVFAELPHERAQKILGLFLKQGWEPQCLRDLNQRDRVLIAQRK